MHAKTSDGDAGSLSTMKGLAFFLAAYLYFAGFIYEHYLYSSLGISLGTLDIPFYYVLVYSFTVIISNRLCIVLVGVAWSTLAILSLAIPKIRRFSSVIIVVLLVALFPILFSLARTTGQSIAAQMRAGEFVKTIKLVLKPDVAAGYPVDFVKANESDALRLITETKDAFYVLQQNVGSGPALPTGSLYRVPKESVVSARVLLETIRKPGDDK
jgi:hypothetical protein